MYIYIYIGDIPKTYTCLTRGDRVGSYPVFLFYADVGDKVSQHCGCRYIEYAAIPRIPGFGDSPGITRTPDRDNLMSDNLWIS